MASAKHVGRNLAVAGAVVLLAVEIGIPTRAYLASQGATMASPSAAAIGQPAGQPTAVLAAPAASETTSPPTPLPSAGGQSVAPTAPAQPIVLAASAFTQDTLVDPVVTGRVPTGGAAQVVAQRQQGGAWVNVGAAPVAADGSFSLALTAGNGELRTDTWRVVSGPLASGPITVNRTAVLNAAVHVPTRAEVQYSWREGCPNPYTDLRVIDANYYGFDGRMHRGQLVVHHTVVAQFQGLLQQLIDTRFPIRQMRTVEAFKGSDDASAAADNTSAFNCRKTPLGTYWSEHSYGVAIDINPVENPYNNAGELIPAAGAPYLDRSKVRPGMLVPDSPVIKYALANQWAWLAPKDYQHLEW